MRPSDPLPRALVRHGDRPLLLAFAGWLLVAGAGFAGPPPGHERRGAIEAGLARLEAHAASRPALAWSEPELAAALRGALSPPPATAAWPGWLAHRRPGFIDSLRPRAPEVVPVHEDPTLLEVDATGRDRVVLRFAPSDRNAHVALGGWEVWRQAGDGPWERLATLDPAARAHEDGAVRPLGRYRYRVVSLAARDSAVAGDLALPASLARRESAACDEVALPEDRYLVPGTLHEGAVWVWVHTWDPAAGAFARRGGVLVRPGDSVGDTGLVLEEVWVERRPGPLPGQVQDVQVIRYRHPTGERSTRSDK